jgi:hypothetical protein
VATIVECHMVRFLVEKKVWFIVHNHKSSLTKGLIKYIVVNLLFIKNLMKYMVNSSTFPSNNKNKSMKLTHIITFKVIINCN